jgi:hypothetical protein
MSTKYDVFIEPLLKGIIIKSFAKKYKKAGIFP